MEMCKRMCESDEFRLQIMEIIADSLTTCADRVASGIDDIYISLLINDLKKESVTEEQLRSFALGLVRMARLDTAITAHINTLTLEFVDPIEVRIAMRIKLADYLVLPQLTRSMIFRNCAQITDGEIDAIGERIKDEVNEGHVEAFLKTWEPWLIFDRRKKVRTYENLELNKGITISADTRCAIIDDDLTKPIAVIVKGQTHICNYDSYIKAFILTGNCYFTNTSTNLENICKISPPNTN